MIREFKSTAKCLEFYNGPVEVVRPLTDAEADLIDVGPMFKCKAQDGTLFDAFEDELTDEGGNNAQGFSTL